MNQYRVLIVDDNPAIHEDIRKILASPRPGAAQLEAAEELLFGRSVRAVHPVEFVIDSAFQGEEALELVRRSLAEEKPYALAFVDVRMPPGWDGVETIGQVWGVCPELQVIICTAYSDYSWEAINGAIGRSDSLLILKKPFDNIEVLQLAHALTKKWSLARAARSQLENLDRIVAERTAALQAANDRLTAEVAERIETESLLKLSEERFSTAFNSSPMALSIQSLRDGHFLDVNDSYLQMTGYERAELLRRTESPPALWADGAIRDRIFWEVRAGRSVRNVETPIRTKTGLEKQGLLSAERIVLGEEEYALISQLDISQRLQLEAQLRQAQKMEAIGHLAAGVAHDFRNILTVIQGHASLQLLDPQIDPDLASSLTEINQASERAANLTRQLLAYSRKQMLQPEVLSLNELVENLASMLSRLIGEPIRLECRLAGSLPMVEADLCSLEQVLLNLAVNARDAMPDGGELLISTFQIEIGPGNRADHPESRDGLYAGLIVQDTGCGMSEEILERLFEPFFTTKEVGKGTGMGLATAYGIISQHRGWIEVDTCVGAGTTFTLFLPATSKARRQPEARKGGPAAPGGRETILVVEDEEPLRRFVSEFLREHGYNVCLASNGVEALEVWRTDSARIDLLLTDVVMPEKISGLELADRFLRERNDLKVIYTSGYSIDLLDGHFGGRAHVNFLPKPYHPMKLAEIVRHCLDS